MRNISKKLATILSIFLLIIASLNFSGCYATKEKEYERARNRIFMQTNVEIPNDAEIVYHHYRSVFQDWYQYTCFKFDSYPTIINEYDFKIKDKYFLGEFKRKIEGRWWYENWGKYDKKSLLADDYKNWDKNISIEECKVNFEKPCYYLITNNIDTGYLIFFVFYPEELFLIVGIYLM